ncbi:MAG: hypothetical protein COB17_06780 [Sulfurimonas sp.]|nr:MAG: hypothetical protein COB17_06780 [Sulfurimonas sp.]
MRIDITPLQLIKKVNDKCLNSLGYKIIDTITKTANNKIRVDFLNKKNLNFHNFTYAIEYLNVAYNLKLFVNKMKNITKNSTKINKRNKNIEIATNVLKNFIKNFQKSSDKVRVNTLILSDYIRSEEWQSYRFNVANIDEIINCLFISKDILSKRYINIVYKLISKNYL